MGRRVWFTTIAVAISVLLAGCAPKPPANWSLFPDSAHVRVFGAPLSEEMRVEKDGTLQASNFVWKDGIGRPVPAHIIDGGELTPSEVASLRAATKLVSPPPNLPMCCSPRHAFRFYDKAGRHLGDFVVCFECGCTQLWPRPAWLNRDVGVDWNDEALKRIVVAHKLTPIVPPRPAIPAG